MEIFPNGKVLGVWADEWQNFPERDIFVDFDLQIAEISRSGNLP
jgi:hypothetical protein